MSDPKMERQIASDKDRPDISNPIKGGFTRKSVSRKGSGDSKTRYLILESLARRITAGRPHLIVVAATLIIFSFAYAFSFLLRFEFSIPEGHSLLLTRTLPFVLLIKLVVFYVNGIYRMVWAYIGLKDLQRIFWTVVFCSGVMGITNLMFLPDLRIPRSILIMDGTFTLIAISGLFAGLRSFREGNLRKEDSAGEVEPVLIVGAGDAGDALLRELQRTAQAEVRVVGFLDDEAGKKGRVLRGVPILGPIDGAEAVVRKTRARKAYIAIPGATGADVRRIVYHLLQAGLAVRILPSIEPGISDSGVLPELRNLIIEDLLKRAPVKLDEAGASKFITGKTVLVTGAAGSIGSELCRQVLKFKPNRLIALDIAETPLHDLMLELQRSNGSTPVRGELADITDRARIDRVFSEFGPELVFHAAALKHVPLLEDHPRDAVRVNIRGTQNVAESALQHGAEAFVQISTDKAVNPTSVMGTTKRVAEMLVGGMTQRGHTRYMSVRFGNVLGSNGSVLQIFRRQLARRGPLTVTHPEMKRYFMTIPEAVQLVIQAAVLGEGGEIFVLDMGNPVRIVDMAEDLIKLSGLVPGVDVKIEFTGIRPGEKLFEELHLDCEEFVPTSHPQVYILRVSGRAGLNWEELSELETLFSSNVPAKSLVAYLRNLLPLTERRNWEEGQIKTSSPLA